MYDTDIEQNQVRKTAFKVNKQDTNPAKIVLTTSSEFLMKSSVKVTSFSVEPIEYPEESKL